MLALIVYKRELGVRSVRRRDIRNGRKDAAIDRLWKSSKCAGRSRCSIDVFLRVQRKRTMHGEKRNGATVTVSTSTENLYTSVNRDAWHSSVSSKETGRHCRHVIRRLAFTIQGYEYDFNRIKNGRRIWRVSVCICIRVRVHVHTWYAARKVRSAFAYFYRLLNERTPIA